MSQKFQKRVEDFVCGHCGAAVTGNGFTNHCPVCLYSRHVDIYPGDRAEICGGLMKPIAVALKRGRYVITHQCQKCGEERPNEAAPEDEIGKFLTGLV
ncbi:MAG: RNHCP domain-containing protein, partial [Candidatus Vogelbacteria bacterium CG10_big_fil_rev_8_21_14_0_10_49_38]